MSLNIFTEKHANEERSAHRERTRKPGRRFAPAQRRCALRRLFLAAAVAAISGQAIAATPVPVKAVVVSMFENGDITGDDPGEFQLWVEREKLDRTFDFPAGEYPLRMNEDGLLAICTGGGIPNATASVMALGLDPRFDLRQAYWLIAGIAGGDPEDVSLGTAAWAEHVVDGDLLYEIDAREIPADWPYGLLPLGAKKPNDTADGWTVDTLHFALNAGLARWAYALTRDHPVADSAGIAAFRQQFKGYPNAVRPPFVTIGDSLSSSTYWHGERLNAWANDWVRLQGGGRFVMSNMEDSGTLTALRRLWRVGRVDLDRVMVLRTASNYTMPPKGEDAAWSTTAPYPEKGRPALEAAYLVGSRVVHELIEHWPDHRDTPPSAP